VGHFKSSVHSTFFSIKMNFFFKIHLQAFTVIPIVLYHSVFHPTFGQVLYSCQDAFVVDASDYWGHLIRHLLNASEAFPTEWFLQFWEQVKVWWAHVRTVRRVGKHLPSILSQNFRYCTWGMRPRVIVQNEFLFQNIFTGLHCNPHCAYHSVFQRLGKSCIPVSTPSLLMRPITGVTSLDTSSMLPKRFPRSGFFNCGNKSKSGGLMSGLYGGWGSTCHPYFPKISRYCTWAMRPRVIVQNEDTGCEHGGHFFGESLDAKHLAETFCSMPLLQWTTVARCCYHSILVISHNHRI